ncbi:hypothetical protein ACFWPV_26310 [Streptomyces uncialis]|uniref:hypothetical protein n=1 Tax=Streptomyces uncialis TaxID=1048205 RepID=UPI003667A0B6
MDPLHTRHGLPESEAAAEARRLIDDWAARPVRHHPTSFRDDTQPPTCGTTPPQRQPDQRTVPAWAAGIAVASIGAGAGVTGIGCGTWLVLQGLASVTLTGVLMATLPFAALAMAATAIGGAISKARSTDTNNVYEGPGHPPHRDPQHEHYARHVLRPHPQRQPLTRAPLLLPALAAACRITRPGSRAMPLPYAASPPSKEKPTVADHNDHTPPVPSLEDLPGHKEPRPAALCAWWAAAWDDDGFLHDRWEDLRRAPELGWHSMANWVKTALGLTGICVVLILLDSATDVLADALHHLLTAVPHVQVGTDTSTGITAVVDQPIRSYIAAHTGTLPVSASTVYTLWQLTGVFGLIGGLLRSSGARLTWTAWGCASVAMVWSGAPADGRTVATGLAVLAWTAASALALRGLTLRPSLFIHNAAPGLEIRPEIHVLVPAAPAVEAAPDYVHPLQR